MSSLFPSALPLNEQLDKALEDLIDEKRDAARTTRREMSRPIGLDLGGFTPAPTTAESSNDMAKKAYRYELKAEVVPALKCYEAAIDTEESTPTRSDRNLARWCYSAARIHPFSKAHYFAKASVYADRVLSGIPGTNHARKVPVPRQRANDVIGFFSTEPFFRADLITVSRDKPRCKVSVAQVLQNPVRVKITCTLPGVDMDFFCMPYYQNIFVLSIVDAINPVKNLNLHRDDVTLGNVIESVNGDAEIEILISCGETDIELAGKIYESWGKYLAKIKQSAKALICFKWSLNFFETLGIESINVARVTLASTYVLAKMDIVEEDFILPKLQNALTLYTRLLGFTHANVGEVLRETKQVMHSNQRWTLKEFVDNEISSRRDALFTEMYTLRPRDPAQPPPRKISRSQRSVSARTPPVSSPSPSASETSLPDAMPSERIARRWFELNEITEVRDSEKLRAFVMDTFTLRRNGLFGEVPKVQDDGNVGGGLMNPGAICLMFAMFVESYRDPYFKNIVPMGNGNGKKSALRAVVAMGKALHRLRQIEKDDQRIAFLAHKNNRRRNMVWFSRQSMMSEMIKYVKVSGRNSEYQRAQNARFNAITMHLYNAMVACVDSQLAKAGTFFTSADEEAAKKLCLFPGSVTKFGFHMFAAQRIAHGNYVPDVPSAEDGEAYLPQSIHETNGVVGKDTLKALLDAYFTQAAPNATPNAKLTLHDVEKRLFKAKECAHRGSNPYAEIICDISVLGLYYQYLVTYRKIKQKDINTTMEIFQIKPDAWHAYSPQARLELITRCMTTKRRKTDKEKGRYVLQREMRPDAVQSAGVIFQTALKAPLTLSNKYILFQETALSAVCEHKASTLLDTLDRIIEHDDDFFAEEEDKYADNLKYSDAEQMYTAGKKKIGTPVLQDIVLYLNQYVSSQKFAYRFCRTVVRMMMTEFQQPTELGQQYTSDIVTFLQRNYGRETIESIVDTLTKIHEHFYDALLSDESTLDDTGMSPGMEDESDGSGPVDMDRVSETFKVALRFI